MSERPVDLLLDDICEAIDRIKQYTAGLSFDAFSKDQKTIDAVVRNLEIIGEASNRLPVISKRETLMSNGTRSWGFGTGLFTCISALTFRLSGKSCKKICHHCKKHYLGFADKQST